ncbi:MAG: TetR/AcrR family transcriptional regulator [bacterium]|nr:TetR/AcrR family transcriptional regulator [bacterium]
MPANVDKSTKRAEILLHAADAFSRSGFHNTKMQDIATLADIGKGTIYEYFRTKEELFLAIYDAWMTSYESIVQERVNNATDAIGKVDAIRDSAVEFYMSRAEQAPLLLEFWAHALRSKSALFSERVHKNRAFLRQLGVQITDELVKAGWFTKVHAESFTMLEAGISDGIFFAWIMEDRGFPLDKAFTFRQSVIGLGLLAGDARGLMKERLEGKLKKGF